MILARKTMKNPDLSELGRIMVDLLHLKADFLKKEKIFWMEIKKDGDSILVYVEVSSILCSKIEKDIIKWIDLFNNGAKIKMADRLIYLFLAGNLHTMRLCTKWWIIN